MPVRKPVLGNYIELIPGARARLVLTNPVVEEVTIPDKVTKATKTLRRLRWEVLEVDGEPTHTYFHVLSRKLAETLMALWDRRIGDRICVEITEFGTGLAKDYEVKPC